MPRGRVTACCYGSMLRPILNMRPKFRYRTMNCAGALPGRPVPRRLARAEGHRRRLPDRPRPRTPRAPTCFGRTPSSLSSLAPRVLDGADARRASETYLGERRPVHVHRRQLAVRRDVERRSATGRIGVEVRRWGAAAGRSRCRRASGYHSTTGEQGGIVEEPRPRPEHARRHRARPAPGSTAGSPYRRSPTVLRPAGRVDLRGHRRRPDRRLAEPPGQVGRRRLRVRPGRLRAGLAGERRCILGVVGAVQRVAQVDGRRGDVLHPRVATARTSDDPQVPGGRTGSSRSDMAYLEYPNGGAVFSAGAICWRGSAVRPRLRRNRCRSVTENVLRRFADPDWRRSEGVSPDRGRRRRRRSGRRSRTIRPATGASRGSRGSASGAVVLSHRVGTTREGSGRTAAPGPERRRRDDVARARQPVRGRAARRLGPARLRPRGNSRTAASSRSWSRSTRRPRPAAVQPRHRGTRPRSEPRRAIRRRWRDLVGALGARGRPARPTRAARVSSALPDGGAPVHVRDVQDVRRRRAVLALHRRRAPIRRRRPDMGTSRSISAASDPDGDPHDTMWWDPRIARLGVRRRSSSATTRSGTRDAAREGPVHIGLEPGRRRDLDRAHVDRSAGPGDLSRCPSPTADSLVFQQRRAETQVDGRGRLRDDGGQTFDRGSETRRLRARRRRRHRARTAR